MPIGPRWSGDDYSGPDEYARMRRTILAEMKRRGRRTEGFVFTSIINMSDTKTLKSEIEQFSKSGMNYFTLGDKAKDDDSVRNIERVARDVGGSL